MAEDFLTFLLLVDDVHRALTSAALVAAVCKTKYHGLANVLRERALRPEPNREGELVSRAGQEGVVFRLRGGPVSPVSSKRSRKLMSETMSVRQFTHFFAFSVG